MVKVGKSHLKGGSFSYFGNIQKSNLSTKEQTWWLFPYNRESPQDKGDSLANFDSFKNERLAKSTPKVTGKVKKFKEPP